MSFGDDIDAWCTGTMARVERIRRLIVIKLFSAIIQDTPVLDGRLRGNWQCSVGSPKSGVLPIRNQEAALDEVNSTALTLKANEAIYLDNNLPYARRIEFEGWSHTKAPEGMMRKNVMRFYDLVNAAIAEGRL